MNCALTISSNFNFLEFIFLKYFFSAIALVLIFWFLLNQSEFIAPKARSVDFLNQATILYTSSSKVSTTLPIRVSHHPNLIQRINFIEDHISDLYNAEPKELVSNISLIYFLQKQLELQLAYSDQKIDAAILLDPLFRIALATYLDIPFKDLTEKEWMDAEISNKTWNELQFISRTNDFRIMLLQEENSKDKIDQLIRLHRRK